MNYDTMTASAIVAELRQTLVPGRVQDCLEIGNEALGFEIYAGQRHYLLVSANPQQARVHIVPDRVRRGVEQPSPLGLMLRRYVEGGKLVDITQPLFERVIQFEFEAADGHFTLIAEIMDKRSNVLLVRGGVIMDCMRRVGAHENRVRVSLPGQPYVPPPPQSGKRPPTDITEALLREILSADPGKVAWKALTDQVLGFSPMLARETIYRAAGDSKAIASRVDPAALLTIFEDFISPLLAGSFEPGITETAEGITSFSAYEVTHLPGWHPVDSISEALTAYFGAPVGDEAYEAGKQPVQIQLIEAIEKVSRKLEALERSFRDDSERERLRQSGELILAYQYQIQAGQTVLRAQYDFDQPELDIPLDPKQSPLDNAKAYFEKYEKAKRAAEGVPQLIEATYNELAFLRQLEADLKLAANWNDIGEVQDALQAGGYWRGQKSAGPQSGKSAPLKASLGGFVVWVGRNSRQNEEVTFARGRPEDLWLHVRGIPGAHVIVKSEGRPVPPAIIERAAAIAAYYSPARESTRVEVDVTQRKHVRKIKGGAIGLVTYRHETTLSVTPGKDLD